MHIDPYSIPLDFVIEDVPERVGGELRSVAGRSGAKIAVNRIGNSRAGLPLWGYRFGSGTRHVSITAGAHADEPAGPMAAVAFSRWLISDSRGQELLRDFTFFVCPQINPDGAAANCAWFSDPADPFAYFQNVIRELPGDDIEFGYPEPKNWSKLAPACSMPPRPENIAVAGFLEQGAPFHLHGSLHGMAFAEGAWFLIGRDWVGESASFQAIMAAEAAVRNLPLHDIERHGEKGFHRIAPGFCTTPTCTAMREYFLSQNDVDTAGLFRPSSMEYVQSLGGDPRVMVTEMPIFLIDGAQTRSNPPGPDTAYTRFRASLVSARALAGPNRTEALRKLLQAYHLRPVPFSTQVGMILTAIVAALESR
ncbi:MAG: hypothetical protein K1X53_12895 [Candidatus Sumerlaeaceae bacterium]|nr:hypothetical protein [Candidatus Sumerlaeaceae bacterium]